METTNSSFLSEENNANSIDKKTPLQEEKSQNIDSINKESREEENLNEIKDDKKNNKDKKVQNLRKNIKDVLDNKQLDEATLAAQKLELERLSRIQEAQRLLRESQRQLHAEQQAIKTQQKVLSILGEKNEEVKIVNHFGDLQSSIEATNNDESISHLTETPFKSDSIKNSESESTKQFVIIDSDSDDCIILSDDEAENEDDSEDENNSGEHTNDTFNKPESDGNVVINIGHKGNESKIYIAPQIARVIKPHQIGGIRFLFDNIIESTELFDKSSGFGCILAHSMGLGKTLQIVCFCDVLLKYTSSKHILIIMPINTIQNWVNEFNLWIPSKEDVERNSLAIHGEIVPRTFKIFVINDSFKSFKSRTKVVLDWKNEGGVLMMGYEMFRLLSLNKLARKRKRNNSDMDLLSQAESDKTFRGIYEALVNPGPSVIICDEGHRIKNASASISTALKQVKTKRRIVLTGYPLQNNLLEYWCMIDFARPDFLGNKAEFLNMFERPIQNGQCIDSTPQDKKLMRYRAHVLHSLLKGFVQRRSHTVLQKCLPVKEEYVLFVKMTMFQRKLYETFMNEVIRSKKVQNPLKAFAVCCKIWNTPDVLYNFLKKKEYDLDIDLDDPNEPELKKNDVIKPNLDSSFVNPNKLISPLTTAPLQMDNLLSLPNFATTDNQSTYNRSWDFSNNSQSNFYSPIQEKSITTNSENGTLQSDSNGVDKLEKNSQSNINNENSTNGKSSKEENMGIPYDWAVDLMKDYVPHLTQNSPKVEIFLTILEESIKMNDRLLLFSQSLLTLNLLELILSKRKIPNTEDEYWAKNKNYFRLDGSTQALEREKLINEFNSNEHYKLFLVSTRAGSLGINLVGANRVIVFDASWNPCHDQQAICRVYRYGQKKRCIIYRLVADNCLEKRIYDRQINKQGIADRIVDECNPDAHLSIKEVTSLCYDEEEEVNHSSTQNFSDQKDSFNDTILQKIICEFPKLLAKLPFEHETLLVDRKEKKLSQAEKRLAKRGYEMEKQASNNKGIHSVYNSNYRLYRNSEGTLIQRPFLNSSKTMENLNHSISNFKNESPRPNRWIPVEVWQSKGITAHEMTLPQDVSIQTNSADKSKIFLKAGQKVIVLKSPRGICLQLESGKVIAIRASTKIPQDSILNCNKLSEPQESNDVIDMTNDDDDSDILNIKNETEKKEKNESTSQFKPNIVPRKVKNTNNYPPPPPIESNNIPWSVSENPPPTTGTQTQFQSSATQPTKYSHQYSYNSSNQRNGNSHNYDSSAFHAPSTISMPCESTTPQNSYTPYYSNYSSYMNDVNSIAPPSNYNYYQHSSYPHSMPNYNYSQQSGYNSHYSYRNMYPNYPPQYIDNYSYSQPPPPPPPAAAASNNFPPTTTANYDEWNFK